MEDEEKTRNMKGAGKRKVLEGEWSDEEGRKRKEQER
jgi:hypothetical protein